MITINNIGQFDETKSIWEQSKEVTNFLLPIIDSFNAINCIEFDEFDRPLQWQYEGNGIRLIYRRTYINASYDRMVQFHKFELTALA